MASNRIKGSGAKERKPPSGKVTFYLKDGPADKVRKIALQKGCIVRRGPRSGQGSIGKLLQQIAEGKLTVVRLGKREE